MNSFPAFCLKTIIFGSKTEACTMTVECLTKYSHFVRAERGLFCVNLMLHRYGYIASRFRTNGIALWAMNP